jgi:hypothetical protein
LKGWKSPNIWEKLNKSKFPSWRNKSRLKWENACYHSVQDLLFSSPSFFLIKIYRTIILPVVLYRCEPWSFTLGEERSLRVIEDRVLRRTLGPKRDEVTGEWRKLHNYLYYWSNIFWEIKSRGIKWAMQVVLRGIEEVYTGFLAEKLEGKWPLGRPSLRWCIILIKIFWNWDVGLWNGSSCLRIRTGCGHLSVL